MTADGHLAQTAHPSQLGSRNFHPTIQTDFSEQQLELITPIAHSTKEARRLLGAISDVAGRSIDQEWTPVASCPCHPQLTEEEIVIARLENEYERYYREGLAKNMAKTTGHLGIHYNMELGERSGHCSLQVSFYHSLKNF